MARGFISPSVSALMTWRVSGVSARCRLTKSDIGQQLGELTSLGTVPTRVAAVAVEHPGVEPAEQLRHPLADPAEADEPDSRADEPLPEKIVIGPPAGADDASPSATRRAAPNINVTASSAVASLSTPGVLVARTPRTRTAARSMLSMPTPKFATTASDSPAASSSLPSTGVGGCTTIAAAPSTRASSEP